ncbi:5' exonuclease Apollo [Euphorbia peplus]|nr:5' exonuclease Apollo [Euphorbia peplus]
MEKGLLSVDRWTEESQAYFLTHLHSDHTQGLTCKWTKGPLFCSAVTAKLFPSTFPQFDLSLLHILHPGIHHSISLLSPSGSPTLLHVLPIHAHHCPGAVMFLFRGDFGCVLYTGDFRWETTNERAIIRDALKGESVDILYLDNTYCNPSFGFPPRQFAADQVVDLIQSHPEHDVIIGIDSLGKEDLLLHISHKLNTKIWVWPERLQTMHLLGYHDIFTTRTCETRVRAVPRYSFSIDTLEGLNSMKPTIGIMASGLPWMIKHRKGYGGLFSSLLTSQYEKGNENEGTSTSMKCVEKVHDYIYAVAYSDHSCFAEIQDFVELVNPASLKGIVSSSSCDIDPLYHFGRLCGENQKILQNTKKEKKKRDRRVDLVGKCKYRKAARITRRIMAFRRLRRGTKINQNDSSD